MEAEGFLSSPDKLAPARMPVTPEKRTPNTVNTDTGFSLQIVFPVI